jgi:type I restriction enzyme S subunit
MEVKPGYKKTEVGVIPEDWEAVKFGEFVFYKKGFAFRSSDYTASGTRIVRVSDTNSSSILDENAVYISDKSAGQFSAWRLKTDDLIFTTVGSKPPMYDSLVGKAILVHAKHSGALLNQNAVIIRNREHNYFTQRLLLNHFRMARYIRYIEQVFRGNANQASITLKDLFDYSIPFPPTQAEQTAIATALSDVDALIESLEQLIKKKRQIKQGAMQELLTGKRRLPGFGNGKNAYKKTEVGVIPEDWQVQYLSKICNKITTGKLDANAMKPDGVYPFYTCAKERYWIDEFAFDDEALLISGNGANVGYIHFYKGKFNAYQRTYVLTGFSSVIHFVKAFLERNLQERIKVEANAGNTPYIVMGTLAEMQIALPPTKVEQTAIANALSDMDSEIESLETKLSKTRNLKQGMMQELLTGRIRLV